MKIQIMTLHVDDQTKALRFYSEVLGFKKKADFSNGGYRWLTVASPEAPDGPELQLEANTNPAARAYQQARFQQSQPAAMFFVDDVQSEYDRLTGLGVKFTVPPSKVTGSTIAMLDDTCGNLIQITALDRGQKGAST
jgi:predicted enzyme related to lactoylglutathione lyase